MLGSLPPLIFIGAVVLIVVALLAMDRASSGQHVWAPGAAMPAPAGDPATVTRHVWRPGAEDTIRVDALLERIAVERRPGRHRLIEEPPAVDEGQGDQGAVQLRTQYPLPTHAAAA